MFPLIVAAILSQTILPNYSLLKSNRLINTPVSSNNVGIDGSGTTPYGNEKNNSIYTFVIIKERLLSTLEQERVDVDEIT